MRRSREAGQPHQRTAFGPRGGKDIDHVVTTESCGPCTVAIGDRRHIAVVSVQAALISKMPP